jgi:sensor histidine kinase regulating citrate/malate metabolism
MEKELSKKESKKEQKEDKLWAEHREHMRNMRASLGKVHAKRFDDFNKTVEAISKNSGQ